MHGLTSPCRRPVGLPFYDYSIRVEADTRYSGWGRRAAVLLPPPSYVAASCGGPPLPIIKEYIGNQKRPG
ncbi:hypothetical protein [Nonomuraea sp. B5E05]|uniref:hypothetical protein n=1 Tax=Nonomuraea sp. B5E05 TaxID=3153569 RepID=UPI0032607E6D